MIPPILKKCFDWLLGLGKLRKKLDRFGRNHGENFWSQSKEFLNLNIQLKGEHFLEEIDPEKPLIVISNHPHGLLDGVCLANIIQRDLRCSDFKFIANSIIGKIFTDVRPYVISIDNMKKTSNPALVSGASLFESLKYLRENKVIALHPAGEVSEFKFFSPEGYFKITDCPWKTTFIDLAVRTKASILPIHISGRNSLFYQMISFLGSTAKRIWNFREFMKAKGKDLTITIRPPIHYWPSMKNTSNKDIALDIRKVMYGI